MSVVGEIWSIHDRISLFGLRTGRKENSHLLVSLYEYLDVNRFAFTYVEVYTNSTRFSSHVIWTSKSVIAGRTVRPYPTQLSRSTCPSSNPDNKHIRRRRTKEEYSTNNQSSDSSVLLLPVSWSLCKIVNLISEADVFKAVPISANFGTTKECGAGLSCYVGAKVDFEASYCSFSFAAYSFIHRRRINVVGCAETGC